MEGPLFWVAALVAAVLVGMSKGGLPVVGMLGVPVLALQIPAVSTLIKPTIDSIRTEIDTLATA